MLAEVLPPGAAFVEVFADASTGGALDSAEAALVAQASDGRRREFATGRICARGALAALGVAPEPVLRTASRAPRWPAGVVGSITHCAGYRAAAVAHAGELASLGIDAEPARPLNPRTLRGIALPGELARLTELCRAAPEVPWDRALFSAKEALYKTWNPLTGRWLGFRDAEITMELDGTFQAIVLTHGHMNDNGLPATFPGRWRVKRNLVVTCCHHPATACEGENPYPPAPSLTPRQE